MERKKYKSQKRINKKRKINKRLSYKEYSHRCKFRFDIEDYINEFDVELIQKYGWYSEDNPLGLTKDHMLSISYGWKRDIPSSIIKHPANCQLMFYNENHNKGWRSSINYQQLLNRIKKWDSKYS